jgi:hypothetical protein
VPRVWIAGWLALALIAGCGQPAAPLSVSIVPATPAAKAFITVHGFSSDELASLTRANYNHDQWLALMRVLVDGPGDANPPVAGQHRVTSTSVDFVPTFPFDPGRGYAVEVDPSKLPAPRATQSFRTVVVMPAASRAAPAIVTRALPSAATVPENLLRMYLEFSAPMAREHGRDFLKLVEIGADGRDTEVRDAFLALDVDFWSPDGRRYTVLFDPGRVKRGILPNDQFGRALKPGHRYALVVDPKWRDEHGQPLASAFRHEFAVGSADMSPIALNQWAVMGPASLVQSALVVRFPKPLDHGLLQRALGVELQGKPVDGDVEVAANETEWRFTPKAAWQPGRYALVVLSILEDPMGNKIGRSFDVDSFQQIDKSPAPDRITLPFVVR